MPTKKSLTINEREQLVLALLAGEESAGRICRRWGVSRQTAYKFRRRFLACGRAGLRDQRRGRKLKYRLRWAQYRQMLLAQRRRHPTRGARKLLWGLRTVHPGGRLPSARTVERWLRTADLVRCRRVRRRIKPKPLQKYRRARRSNEVWTIDWKGWRRTQDQAKIEPLTIRDLGSRYILWSQPLANRSDQAVRRVCAHLFRKHGRPKAMRSDLGAPFCSVGPYGLTSLSLWWYRLGIGVEFVRRGAGIDNNAHEQMHAVLQAETATPTARTREAQLRRLRRWQHYYNYDRPHDSIGNRPPAHRYRSQPEKLPALLVPRYPSHWQVRSVNRRGTIGLYGRLHHVGVAFAGLQVGCKPSARGCTVYFHRLKLLTLSPPLHPNLRCHQPT